MSDKYKIRDNDKAYFVTLTIVGWIDVFTRKEQKFKVWQDGNQAKEIFSNKFLYEKLNYTHKNPVEDLIVANAEDYLYSSARNYAGLDSYLDVCLVDQKLITYGQKCKRHGLQIRASSEILQKLDQLQKKEIEQDDKIMLIFEYLKQLEQVKQEELEQKNRKRIGYNRPDEEQKYK